MFADIYYKLIMFSMRRTVHLKIKLIDFISGL